MLNRLRNLPDAELLFLVIVIGMLIWILLILFLKGIDSGWKAFKRTTSYKCIRLQQENQYLKEKIKEIKHHAR